MSDAVSTGGAAVSAPATAGQTGSQNTSANGASQASSQGAPNTGETKTQAQERILAEQDLDAFVEHTVNGQKQKIKVRDALKGYGKEQAAEVRMREAAQTKKQAQQLMHMFQTDPDRFFEVTGVDQAQWLKGRVAKHVPIAEEILAGEYERQQMSPEQRELQDVKAKLAQHDAMISKQRAPLISEIKKIVPENMLPKGLDQATPEQLHRFLQVKQQEFKAGVDNLSSELLGAWEKVGLPKQKEFGQWMAQVMSDYQKKTGEALHPEQAAARVKARFLDSTRSLLSQMDAKALQETLGEAVLQKLRDADIAQVRSSGPQFGVVTGAQASPAATEPKKTMNQFEFRQWAGLK